MIIISYLKPYNRLKEDWLLLLINIIYWFVWHTNQFIGFYGISTIVGYLRPDPLYTYKYMICKHILFLTFLNKLLT